MKSEKHAHLSLDYRHIWDDIQKFQISSIIMVLQAGTEYSNIHKARNEENGGGKNIGIANRTLSQPCHFHH